MKSNTNIWIAIIGASAVVLAALIPALLSPKATEEKASPQKADNSMSSKEKFTPRPLSGNFIPSGWMGDGEEGERYLTSNSESQTIEGSSKVSLCFSYTRGPKGWAGVYWQHPENNWGDVPGVSLKGASRIVFFSRGRKGGEIVEFVSGGITGKNYSDSYRESTGKLTLNNHWTEYSLDIQGHDLSSVIGAFAWSASGAESGPLEFCVADITIH